MIKETIDSLNLTFSTESQEDLDFIVKSFTILSGAVLTIKIMSETGKELGRMLDEGADERVAIPVMHRMAEMQDTLWAAADTFADMIKERKAPEVNIPADGIHDMPGAVQ